MYDPCCGPGCGEEVSVCVKADHNVCLWKEGSNKTNENKNRPPSADAGKESAGADGKGYNRLHKGLRDGG